MCFPSHSILIDEVFAFSTYNNILQSLSRSFPIYKAKISCEKTYSEIFVSSPLRYGDRSVCWTLLSEPAIVITLSALRIFRNSWLARYVKVRRFICTVLKFSKSALSVTISRHVFIHHFFILIYQYITWPGI